MQDLHFVESQFVFEGLVWMFPDMGSALLLFKNSEALSCNHFWSLLLFWFLGG